MKELGAPIRQWVPDWLGLICIFIVILPVTMLNGSYTGSMLEVSNTLGTNTEDITMGYYAAAAGMAVGTNEYLEPVASEIAVTSPLNIFPGNASTLIRTFCPI
jgi:hypothetical protein